MTRIDEALAKLRDWDEAVGPGTWEAAPDFSTTLGHLSEISPSTSVIPLTAPALPAGKGYGVGWIRTEADARLAALAKGHLLQAMGVLAKYRNYCTCCCPDTGFRQVLTDLADAILGLEKQAAGESVQVGEEAK